MRHRDHATYTREQIAKAELKALSALIDRPDRNRDHLTRMLFKMEAVVIDLRESPLHPLTC